MILLRNLVSPRIILVALIMVTCPFRGGIARKPFLSNLETTRESQKMLCFAIFVYLSCYLRYLVLENK